MTNYFDNISDDLDSLINAPARTQAPRVIAGYTPVADRRFIEKCPHCINGLWRGRPGYPCFKCKGQGKQSFATSPETRTAARARSAEKAQEKAAARADAIVAFINANEALVDWLNASAKRNRERNGTFGFPQAMLDAIAQYGSLTDGQKAAVERLMAKDADRKAEAAQARENAPAINVAPLEAAFAKARENAAQNRDGIRWLKLRLDTFVFSDAPAKGDWPAAILIKEGETKLGRIVGGKLLANRSCDPSTSARILAAAADPKASAIAYGLKFKSCAVCGRELTAEDSRNLGIGPICAEKYGW